MSERLSTLGMTVQYAVETTPGTRPTTGYKKIPEIKSIPSFNPTPNTLDSTTLEETEYMTYVAGLKDLGGALEFGANLTEGLITAWETLMTAYEDAVEAGNAVWFAIVHPKLAKATYFVGTPSPLGINEASVNAILETTLYITPNSAPEMEAKPTA